MCVFSSTDILSKAGKSDYFRYAGISGGYIVFYLLIEDCWYKWFSFSEHSCINLILYMSPKEI